MPIAAEVRAKFERVEALAAELTLLAAHIAAGTYRFLVLLREFDLLEGSGEPESHSTALWLNYQCGMSLRTAQEQLRVAHALPGLPKIADAFAKGEISFSKVRAMTRVATPANEDYLLSFARAGTAWHVEQLVRKYRGAERHRETAEAKRQFAERSLTYWYDEDGSLVIHGRLPAELGGMVVKAIEAAQEQMFRNAPEIGEAEGGDFHSRPVDGRSAVREPSATEEAPAARVQPPWIPEDFEGPPARRADALAFLAESFLANGGATLAAGERYLLHVHVDETALPANGEGTRCHVEDGTAIAAETARRIGCDCSRVCIHEADAGLALSVGRKTRQIPPAIRRALRSRDGGCQFPGCVHWRFVDSHHIEHWADGGETRLENLVTLCRRHHRLVHEGGYGVAASESGLVFTDPRGRVLRCRVVPAVTGGAAALAAEHRRAGLGISHRTIRPDGWYGERVDWGWAVEGLQGATDRAAL